MSRFGYQRPPNEDAFEDFCLALLQEARSLRQMVRYGRRGERQHGVDLLDMSGAIPLVAAQCKHHDATKAIPPTEIDDEVAKALTFPETIGQYILLTTAKRSTQAQLAVRKINVTHRAQGHFLVELLTWDDIEPLINSSPRAQELLGHRVQQATALLVRSELKGHLEPIHDAVLHQSADRAIDDDLNEAKSRLASGDPTAAMLFVQRARRAWARASARQRHRTCSLEADACARRGQRERAARLLIEARTHLPEDEGATSNEILARQMLNESATARALAHDARLKFPLSAPIYASCINLAATTDDALSLASDIPSTIADSSEVLCAVAARADLGERAHTSAHRAVELFPSDARTWFALGSLLLNSELAKPPAARRSTASRELLEESRRALARVIDLAAKGGDLANEVAALLPRMTASALLGDASELQRDAERAERIAPDDGYVLLACGKTALERDDPRTAVTLLRRAIVQRDSSDARFVLALALWNRNDPGDRAEATRLLVNVATGEDSGHRDAAAELGTEGLLYADDIDGATTFLATLDGRLDEALTATLRARVAAQTDASSSAQQLADLALSKRSTTTAPATISKLGKVLVSLGRHADALELFQSISAPGTDGDVGRWLVDCAMRLERHDVVLAYCRKSRAVGSHDEYLLRCELRLLDTYDPSAAMQLLRETLERTPENHSARVHLMVLACRVHDLDAARTHLDALPSVVDVDAEEGAAIVGLLLTFERDTEALSFSYDLLRRHFDDHRAHRAYRNVVLHIDQKRADHPEEPNTVAPGVAVCLVEDGVTPRWYVLEDSSVSARVEHEIASDSSLAKRLVGKALGEDVVLSDPPMRRTARVSSIVTKYTYRVRDVLEHWQFRFPDQQEMWMMKFEGEGPDLDVTPLLEFGAQRRKEVEEVEAFYSKNLVPIGALARLLHRTELEAVDHVAGRESLRLRCCIGTAAEFEEARRDLKSAGEVVLELSAIATLIRMEELHLLDSIGKRPILSQSTMLALRAAASERSRRRRGDSGTTLTAEGQDDALERALAWFEVNATVVDALPVAELEPEARKQLHDVVGIAALESAVIAAQPNRVLWTDDGVLAMFVRTKFGVARTWTQSAIGWMVDEGRVPTETMASITVRLIAWGYDFTSCSEPSMRAAGDMAEWKIESAPLKAVLAYLALDTVALLDAVRLFAQLVRHGYASIDLQERRQALMLAGLDSLGRRRDLSERALDDLRVLLPRVFGLNVVGCANALETLKSWRTARRHRVVIRS